MKAQEGRMVSSPAHPTSPCPRKPASCWDIISAKSPFPLPLLAAPCLCWPLSHTAPEVPTLRGQSCQPRSRAFMPPNTGSTVLPQVESSACKALGISSPLFWSCWLLFRLATYLEDLLTLCVWSHQHLSPPRTAAPAMMLSLPQNTAWAIQY